MKNRLKKLCFWQKKTKETSANIEIKNSDEKVKSNLDLLKERIKFAIKDTTYSGNYQNPPIPKGYIYIEGLWNDGLIIERTSDGSRFVWIPVGSLKPNGCLDEKGNVFNHKFGKRDFYQNDPSSFDAFFQFDDDFLIFNNEKVRRDDYMLYHFSSNFTVEERSVLLEQIESVKKYGGFYISCFNISLSQTKELQSKKGYKPITGYRYSKIKRLCANFEKNDEVSSHLTFGCEYDSILEWLLETNSKTYDEIFIDSRGWGNYLTDNSFYQKYEIAKNKPDFLFNYDFTKYIKKCGSNEDWYANGIYDLAGNVSEMTQERLSRFNPNPVIRGGDCGCGDYGYSLYPVACRGGGGDENVYLDYKTPIQSDSKIGFVLTGFRIALCLK